MPPVMLLVINGAAIALAQAPWPELWMAALILTAVGAVVRGRTGRAPYADEWNDSLGDARRDAAHAFVNETALLLTVLVIPVMAVLGAVSQTGGHHRSPFVVAGADRRVSVTDLGVTLVHLASHKVSWLWRFHAVHHSVKRFYGFNGLMKHPPARAARISCWHNTIGGFWACPSRSLRP